MESDPSFHLAWRLDWHGPIPVTVNCVPHSWAMVCIRHFGLNDCQEWFYSGRWILQLCFLWWLERKNNSIIRHRAIRQRNSQQGDNAA